MPLPLIPVAMGLVGVGGVGIGAERGFRGFNKVKRARRVQEEAFARYERERRKHLRRRANAQRALAEFGEAKLGVAHGPLRSFTQVFSQLKHVEFEGEVTTDPLPKSETQMTALQRIDFDAVDAALNAGAVAGALKAGAAAAAGVAPAALGVTGAAASTGTAIGGLSGAALSNATFAWFGGGSLAAGGGGIAAGAAVLSGFAAAPAVLVGGVFVNHKAEKALAQAEATDQEVNAAIAKMRASNAVLDRVASRASDLAEALHALERQLLPLIGELRAWIREQGDYSSYSQDRRMRVKLAFDTAEILAAIVTTRLTNPNGTATRESLGVLRSAQAFAARD